MREPGDGGRERGREEHVGPDSSLLGGTRIRLHHAFLPCQLLVIAY